jgi:hypothetical protein
VSPYFVHCGRFAVSETQETAAVWKNIVRKSGLTEKAGGGGRISEEQFYKTGSAGASEKIQ